MVTPEPGWHNGVSSLPKEVPCSTKVCSHAPKIDVFSSLYFVACGIVLLVCQWFGLVLGELR
jgi:hypothetical protein